MKMWIQILRDEEFMRLQESHRYIWFGFLLLAGDSPFPGEIKVADKMGYDFNQLAAMLQTDPASIESAVFEFISLGMITCVDRVITICNWDEYQSEYQRQKKYRKGYKQKLQGKVTNSSISISTSVSSKVKDKVLYGEFVLLTPKEYDTLVGKHGEPATGAMIDILNNAIGSKGYKYKSHYHTINGWVQKDYYKNNTSPTNSVSTKDKQAKDKAELDAMDKFVIEQRTKKQEALKQ